MNRTLAMQGDFLGRLLGRRSKLSSCLVSDVLANGHEANGHMGRCALAILVLFM